MPSAQPSGVRRLRVAIAVSGLVLVQVSQNHSPSPSTFGTSSSAPVPASFAIKTILVVIPRQRIPIVQAIGMTSHCAGKSVDGIGNCCGGSVANSLTPAHDDPYDSPRNLAVADSGADGGIVDQCDEEDRCNSKSPNLLF